MQQLIQQVQAWANERGLNKPEQAKTQFLKVLSEYGETCDAIIKREKNGDTDIIDGFGDIIVTLIVLCNMKGCLYNESSSEIVCDKSEFADLIYSLSNVCHYVGEADEEQFSIGMAFLTANLYGYIQAFGFTPEQCLEAAYSEIKDRKGVTVNGTFIKDEVQSLAVEIASKVNLSTLDYDDIVVFKNGLKMPVTYIETDLDNADYDYKIKVKNTSGIHSAHLIGSMFYTKDGIFDAEGKIKEWDIVAIHKA